MAGAISSTTWIVAKVGNYQHLTSNLATNLAQTKDAVTKYACIASSETQLGSLHKVLNHHFEISSEDTLITIHNNNT